METLKQLLFDKKFRTWLYIAFAASLLIAFVFSAYIMFANIESINDRYHDAKIRYQRLHSEHTPHYRQNIVDER